MLQKVATVNPYIHKIRQSLSCAQPLAVDWLVLSHNDTQMLAQLEEAFPDAVLAVLSLPPNRLQTVDEKLIELVEWAVAELGIKGVMLVGHSQQEMFEEQVKLLGSKASRMSPREVESLVSYPSFLDRMKAAQQQAAMMQEYVANLIDNLSQITLKHGHKLCAQIRLHGLFYRAESGIFYAYDQQQRSFTALLNEVAVA